MLLSFSVKLQPTLAVLTVSVVLSFTAVSANVPILAAAALLPSAKPGRLALASVDFSTKPAVWVSIRSRSPNVIVPEVDRVGVAVSSITPPVAVVDAPTIVGVSLVPVIVTDTSCVTVPP